MLRQFNQRLALIGTPLLTNGVQGTVKIVLIANAKYAEIVSNKIVLPWSVQQKVF
jgi:hypothetical protein